MFLKDVGSISGGCSAEWIMASLITVIIYENTTGKAAMGDVRMRIAWSCKLNKVFYLKDGLLLSAWNLVIAVKSSNSRLFPCMVALALVRQEKYKSEFKTDWVSGWQLYPVKIIGFLQKIEQYHLARWRCGSSVVTL